MKTAGIIPARYGSSRFPGKPLADICGKPMVWWVYSAAKKVKELDEVYIATDHDKVRIECEKYGMSVIMTSERHKTPNDRIYEVTTKVDADIYVVILGDEPLITPDVIAAVLPDEREQERFYVTNLVTEIKNPIEVVDYTNNKIVTNSDNEILYASRAPIPYPKGSMDFVYRKILGISAMSKESLEFYHNTPRSAVEKAEEIDLLRWTEHHKRVLAIDYDCKMLSVDTPKDLDRVRELMKERLEGDPE